MRYLSLIYAYYDNPTMLANQYANWARYSDWHKRRVRVIIVDDASPRWPAIDVARPEGLPAVEIYRAAVDIPWHQDGARNLGAHLAPTGWLFLSDMDHMLPPCSLERLFKLKDGDAFYTFARIDADTGRHMVDNLGNPKPHPNSYAMRRSLYWQAGGYDEDFCGIYGTDGEFRRQLLRISYRVHLPDVAIVRYSRDVIADASTTTLDRKAYGGPEAKAAKHAAKELAGRQGIITTLDFDWERVL